jgi:hypothetical protein
MCDLCYQSTDVDPKNEPSLHFPFKFFPLTDSFFSGLLKKLLYGNSKYFFCWSRNALYFMELEGYFCVHKGPPLVSMQGHINPLTPSHPIF